jgi:hypothetical protein
MEVARGVVAAAPSPGQVYLASAFPLRWMGFPFFNFIFFAMTQMYVITCQCRQLDAAVL